MAVVAVAFNGNRLDDAESATDWVDIGSGPGGAIQSDFAFQGTNSYARKGTTGTKGVALSDSATIDLSGAGPHDVVLIKYCTITPGLLENLSFPGIRLLVGDSSTTYYYYDVQGADTYPADKSWLVAAIAPSIASHRTGTAGGGAPTLTACDYYGMEQDQTGVSKDLNFGMDSVERATGLTLTGGDGASDDGTWQDFSDFDWGTTTNRYGLVRESEGAYIILGTMTIGTGVATVFNDTGSVITFVDGLFPAGWSGLSIGCSNASNDFDFIDNIFIGNGTAAGEDTRPIVTVIGSTAGSECDFTGCAFTNFASFSYSAVTTVTDCIIKDSGLITQNDSTITGCTISGGTAAVQIEADDTALISDCSFTSAGTGHAIEITDAGAGPLTINLSGCQFSGYAASDGSTGDETILINPDTSSADITLNIVGGGSTPSIMEHASYTGTFTLVVSPVTLTTKVTTTTGTNIQNARALVLVADGTNFPYDVTVTGTSSGTTATITHTAHGLETNDYIQITGANENNYNGVFQITVTGVNTYTYTMPGTEGGASTTGTVKATTVLITGLTDVNGEITDTRSYSVDQAITGRVRKSTSAPFYKTSAIVGTIDKDSGLTVNIQLIEDQ